ncbi:MAG: DNA-3-methyladenine glycosylase 2 family protein [Marivibrio sp.]|uniref:DNA-3-methyladenine glycosylase family protein n=1 Tax=Marivibrio sp. TaxID=2039719 RepID=UPI0032EDB3B7
MRDQASLNAALDALAAQDADVARGLEAVGYPEPRVKEHGFAPLIDAVVSQQISKEAAGAINARVQALMDGAVTPERLLALDPEALRGAGLSRPKVAYCRGVAVAVLDGRLPLDDLPAMTDEAVIQAITGLRGFGRWSAEVYAMFALGRPDIFPADDMALQEALRRLKGLEDRPKGKEARALVAHWAPYRSAGSIFLWRFYRGAPQ